MVDSFVDQVEPFVFVHHRLQKCLLETSEIHATFFGESHFGISPDTQHGTTDILASNAFVDAVSRKNSVEVDSRVVAAVTQVHSLLVQLGALTSWIRDYLKSFIIEAEGDVDKVQTQDRD